MENKSEAMLDGIRSSYLRLTERDQRLHKLAISVDFKASEQFFLGDWTQIEFTLRREDANQRYCIIYWNPFTGSTGMMIFHRSPDGLEKIDIKPGVLPPPKELLVNQWNGSLFEIQPYSSTTFRISLPPRYQRTLKPGRQYELFWTGGQIDRWDWGNIQDHIGQDLKVQDSPLVMPGGPRICFTTVEGKRPIPVPPSPAPIETSARFDGAPILSAEIQCPPIVALEESLYVTVIVKFHPSPTGADEQPILFHIITTLGGTLYRKHGDEWEACEDEDMGFAIYDDPDVEICLGRHEDFVCLRPGETWTRRDYVQFPHDTKALFSSICTREVMWTGGTGELRMIMPIPRS